MTAPAIDPLTYRKVLGHYASGVCVITAGSGTAEALAGMVVSSFTSVSLDPPLVAFFPDRMSSTWPRIEAAGRFCVNMLASDQMELCRRFASRGGDKFAGLDLAFSPEGTPILPDVLGTIECEIASVTEAGDHFIVIGRVLALQADPSRRPLLFFQGGYGTFAPADA